MMITALQLRAFAPNASAKVVEGIVKYQQFMVDAEITTPRRIRHFMAQAATETGGLARLEENLSYSAKRLCAVWPKRFPSLAAAQPYAKNPQKLANKVYGGRLGNDKINDGWTYRGSGILQTTGETNFDEVHKETGLPVVQQPEMLRTFPGALQAACIYWAKRKINKLADADNVTAVTEAVNGGHNGLDDRKAWLVKAKKVWPDKPASAQLAPVAAITPIESKPAPAPALIPVKVPGLDKPMVKSSTMWAALSGLGITGIASAKDAIDSLTGLDWRVTMALVGLGAIAAAYWIISERIKYRQAQRDMVAGVKAASAEQ